MTENDANGCRRLNHGTKTADDPVNRMEGKKLVGLGREDTDCGMH